MMLLLLLKVTLLCVLALVSLPLLRRAGAATRHLVCAGALLGCLLMPLTLLVPPERSAFQVTVDALSSSGRIAMQARTDIGRILWWLWMTGSAAMVVRLAGGYAVTSKLRRGARALPVHRGVPVFYADVAVPVVCGLVRPTIYLPRAAEFWTPSQVDAALRHELQHVERYDLWTLLLGHFICALYWFHPMIWLVAGRLRDEQESACDDAVLAGGFSPASYAEVLLVASRQTKTIQLIGCPMLTNQSLKYRITRVLDNRLTRVSSRTGLRVAAGVAAAAVAIIGLTAAIPRARAAQEAPYKVGNGVSAPRLLQKVEPAYTPEAKDAKIEGTVLLSIVVDADGIARNVQVIKGLGYGLDQQAVEVVENQWRFTPGIKDGQPVSVRATIEINFRLQ